MQKSIQTTTRQNNFDLLRLGAALLVIFSHSFAISGNTEPRVAFYKEGTYGWLGVVTFFLISGFLITLSWDKRNDLMSFLKARCLRIFPALLVVVFLTTFILGPIVTSLSYDHYFQSPLTYTYLKTTLLFTRPLFLPGVFESNILPSINGSLWTLQYEFVLYLVIAALGLVGLLKKRTFVLGLFIVLLYFYSLHKGNTAKIGSLGIYRSIEFASFFFLGSVFYLYKDIIPIKTSLAVIAGIVLSISLFLGGVNNALIVPLFGYLVFFLAFYPSSQTLQQYLPLHKIGDLSYGLYIYAFPIQELVTHVFGGGKMEPLLHLLISLPLALLCAFGSWHLVEKRALQLKQS